jgi:hypothetical protein
MEKNPGDNTSPALYIRRPILSIDLYTNVQRAVQGVMGGNYAFLPRRQGLATVSLLRESEMKKAYDRTPSLHDLDIEDVRDHIIESMPNSYDTNIFVEPEDIVVMRGVKRHLAVTLHAPEVAEEREAVIDAMAELGDTPTPWVRGPGHISFGFFTRPVTPKTMSLIEEAVAQNLPDAFLLGQVGDDPNVRAYLPRY